ncbi:MAG: tRNA adenylyltransferase [Gemmataceae bacterium]|nr:tRNA adenylyltransferase [Gemmata sp.]MDW8196136.1 tRNA adenylyltransferase [Gemmataceae bacterium]
MSDAKLRQAIAREAARLMYERLESEYFTAKRQAAKRLCRGLVKPSDLPSNAEIRDQIQLLARVHEGEARTAHLRDMRLHALRLMRLLARFRPRLIGSVLTGHIRKGSDIDLHLFSDHIEPITAILETEGLPYEVERKHVVKQGEARIFTHIHVFDVYPFELTVYPEDKAHYVFKSSITGQPIERASLRELEELIAREHPEVAIEEALRQQQQAVDPYQLFRLLLAPLENVSQNPRYHPEGDVLYHSLQVFELARQERPWDEEFLQAALLHDVGKGIDPTDHVRAGLDALAGLITERTAFLIGHHMDALEYKKGTLGHRQRQRLEQSEHFEDLMLLRDLDNRGRVPGVWVCTVDEALDYLRELERHNRWK